MPFEQVVEIHPRDPASIILKRQITRFVIGLPTHSNEPVIFHLSLYLWHCPGIGYFWRGKN